MYSAFVGKCGVNCSCEAKLQGEAIVMLASLGERGYALTKIVFLFRPLLGLLG